MTDMQVLWDRLGQSRAGQTAQSMMMQAQEFHSARRAFRLAQLSDEPAAAFEAAAPRTQQAVRPDVGRQEGAATRFAGNARDAIARQAWQMLAFPGRVMREGATTEEMIPWAANMGMNMVGAPITTATPATLGSGAVRSLRAKPLPSDEASRLARAQESGFYMNMPLGHGTSREFSSFDPSRGGATSGAAPGQLGVWSEVRPKAGGIAEEFAERSARQTGGNPQVMPLVHRAKRPGVIELTGKETNQEISATLAQAWDDGFDAVMFKNYSTPGGKSGDILVTKDPAQLRSPYAQFDPAQRESGFLLGSGATDKRTAGLLSGFNMLQDTAQMAAQPGLKSQLGAEQMAARPRTPTEYLNRYTAGMNRNDFINSDALWAKARESAGDMPFSRAFSDLANPIMKERYGSKLTPDELSSLMIAGARHRLLSK